MLDRIGDHVDELDVIEPILGSWMKYRQLRQYADRKKHGPEETLLLSLREHTMTIAHRPKLEILIGEQTVKALEFEVTLALVLEGVVLKVRDARVREILAGRCRGKGTFKCAGFTLLERATKPVELPGITRREGISIPGA